MKSEASQFIMKWDKHHGLRTIRACTRGWPTGELATNWNLRIHTV
jgi:hypothetical protein